MNKPLISAIVCTRNRRKFLRAALGSLINQTIQKKDYEILVIDNGSTDGTMEMVRNEFSAPNLRAMIEPVAGLSSARNTGWKNAAGAYVAYIDDDAVAGEKWLQNIVRAFEENESSVACAGGKVEPVFEGRKPEWLTDEMLSYCAIVDWSREKMILNPGQWIVGTNMAFRRQAIEENGGFDETFKLYNDEVFLFEKIRKAGGKTLYDPEISVKHCLSSARLSKAWFARRYFWQGVVDAILDLKLKKITLKKRFEIAGKEIPAAFSLSGKFLKLLLKNGDAPSFPKRLACLFKWGRVAGILGLKVKA